MSKFISYCCILMFVLLRPAYSKLSDDGVTDDFRTMLANPSGAPKAGESFATYVTRSYVAPMSDMAFFSDPKNSREQWNQQYKTYTGGTSTITVLKILETMGISRRGILNAPNSKRYVFLSHAEQTGMLGIIKGELGFSKQFATRKEKEIMVRELLNIGRSRDSKRPFGKYLA